MFSYIITTSKDFDEDIYSVREYQNFEGVFDTEQACILGIHDLITSTRYLHCNDEDTLIVMQEIEEDTRNGIWVGSPDQFKQLYPVSFQRIDELQKENTAQQNKIAILNTKLKLIQRKYDKVLTDNITLHTRLAEEAEATGKLKITSISPDQCNVEFIYKSDENLVPLTHYFEGEQDANE